MIKNFLISSIIFFILLIFADKIIFLLDGNKYNIYNLQSSSDRNIILREIKPNLEVEVRPGNTYIRTTQGLQNKKYKLKTDNDGFIVNSNNLFRDNKENADIIFFGGSTTELMFVEEKNRFPYLTGDFLTKKLGRQIIVKNSGVSGNNSMHNNLLLIAKGLKYKPKVAFLFSNINDLKIYIRNYNYWNMNNGAGPIIIDNNKIKISQKVVYFIKKNIFPNFANLYSLFISSYFNQKIINKNDNKFNINKALSDFENSFETFIYICKAWDIEPVLITQPSRLDPKDEFISQIFKSYKFSNITFYEYSKYHDLFNKKIVEIANTHNIGYVDLNKYIPSDEKHIYDHVHLTDYASVKSAKIISDYINKNLIELFK